MENRPTRVPHVPRIARDLYEFDAEQVLVYIENSRDDDRHGKVLLDEGIVEIQVALHIEAIVVSSGVRSVKDGGVDLHGVPIVPNVKVVIDWQAAFDMLLFFERQKGGTFLNGKRVEMPLELVQKLRHG